MPAIASLEDLKAAQKDLQEAKDLDQLKAVSAVIKGSTQCASSLAPTLTPGAVLK